jgi:hypothetical protein
MMYNCQLPYTSRSCVWDLKLVYICAMSETGVR